MHNLHMEHSPEKTLCGSLSIALLSFGLDVLSQKTGGTIPSLQLCRLSLCGERVEAGPTGAAPALGHRQAGAGLGHTQHLPLLHLLGSGSRFCQAAHRPLRCQIPPKRLLGLRCNIWDSDISTCYALITSAPNLLEDSSPGES